MAQGGIVSFEPAGQPGAYQATMADGSQQTFFGPSADDFYKRRQASAALGPNALAQNDVQQPQMGPPPPPTASDVPTNPVTRLPGGGVSIPISAARAITQGKKVIPESESKRVPEGGKPSDVPENPSAAQAEGADRPGYRDGYKIGASMGRTMEAVDAQGKKFEGEAIMTADGPRVFRAGTRGSPGGLTGQGKQLMARQAETGHAIAQGREMEAAGMSEGTRLASEDAQQQFDYLKEQQRQNIIQQHQQEEENRQLEERVQKMDASYQAARDEFKSSKVDAGRYMRGNWMAVLGSALGAAGAALARTPNFAMDFVSQNIDRDIRSQEREIEVKGKSADNALADLTRSQGSLQAGKSALKQLLLEKASTQAGMIASSTKTQAVKAEAMRLAGQLQQQYAAGDLERTKGYVDQVYKDRLYYSPGSAGTSGGLYAPRQEALLERQGGQIKGRELALKEQQAAAKAGQEGKLGQRAGTVVATARVARGAIAEMADALGVKRDENGTYGNPDFWSTVDSKIPYSETRQRVQALKGTFMSEIGKAQTGGVLTEQAASEMKHQLDSANTPGELGALLRHYDHTMAEVEKSYRDVAKSTVSGGQDDTAGMP